MTLSPEYDVILAEKVTDTGERKEVPGSEGEHWYWESDEWYYIDKDGHRIE